MKSSTVWGGLLLWICGACTKPQAPHVQAPAPASAVIEHATVVDVRSGTLHPNSSIVYEHGRITRIDPDGTFAAPPSLRVIDAQGRYVVPGYNDMHAHAYFEGGPKGALRLMLANGITGVRQMQGSDAMLAARKNDTLEFEQPSPGVLAMPGEVLTPMNAGSIDGVKEEIAKQKSEGADFIKAVMVNPDVFAAAQSEATRLGLPLVGHIPPAVDALAASNAGMRAVEHMGPGAALLIACGNNAEALRAEVAAGKPLSAPPKLPLVGTFFEKKFRKMVVNPLADPSNAHAELAAKAVAAFDAARCKEFAQALAKNDTWQVPTLIRLHTQYFADTPEHQDDAHNKYVDEETLALWKEVTATFTKNTTPALRQGYQDLYAAQIRALKIFADNNVNMLVGTDAPGGWVVPGFSIHQEFQLLAQAGLSPLKILQMATLDAARFLGRAEDFGAVQVGRRADLVMLEKNPLESVDNLNTVAGVVRQGNYYDRTVLDKVLETVTRL